MTRLDDAVEKILAEESDPWTDLCAETIRMAAAIKRWDEALKRYKESKRDQA